MAKYQGNHPISGQLFTFDSKAAGDTYAAEVFAATGYRVQLFPVAGSEPEPVVQVTEPAVEAAPKGADVPESVAAAQPGVPANG